MLSQLLFVRLRSAEKALRDGRLDEAYRLATAPDLAVHRRAVAVLTSLAGLFVERARSHYRAERFAEAILDLDRAEIAGSPNDEVVAVLRAQIQAVSAEQQRKARSRHERLDAARKRIGDGSLQAGRRLLEQASEHDYAARKLREEMDRRCDDAKHTLESAKKLIAQGQLAEAADRVRKAKSIDAHHEGIADIVSGLCEKVFANARQAMQQGRLGRARDELACLRDLGDTLPAKRELREVLALAQQAAQCLRADRYGEARRHVMSLDRLLPKAGWLHQTVTRLRQLEELRTELCAGPLGESIGMPASGDKHASLDDTVAIPSLALSKDAFPTRLLLLVDGGGSFLILRGDQASVGRAASGDPADVPIFSDLAERHANITRVDEDYFLFSAKDVEVAGRNTKHELLRDGSRVVLGRKAKLTFRLPSRKSLSAILELSDTTKMPNDVRRVVLFHQHATIGSTRNAHIHCGDARSPLVLFERNGALWIRPMSDRQVSSSAQPLRLGEPIEIGGASLVLEPWKINTPGGATL